MTIRKSTTLLIFFGAVAFTVVLSLVLHAVIDQSFVSLERAYAVRDMERVQKAIAYEHQKLDELVVDWAAWDDAYLFLQGKSPEFVASNLNDRTLAALRLSAILFFDAQGRPVWAHGVDPEEGTLTAPPEGLMDQLQPGSPLLTGSHLTERVSGLLLLPRMIAVVAACPILRSDGIGPPAGSLVMIRELNDATAVVLGQRVRLHLTLERADAPPSADLAPLDISAMAPGEIITGPISDKVVAGVVVMADAYGRPALRAEAREPRDIIRQGDVAAHRVLLWMSGGTLLSMAILFLALQRKVLSRLSGLMRQVQAIDGTAEELGNVSLPGSDELSALAQVINSLLFEIERSRDLLAEQFTETQTQKDYLQIILDSVQAGVMLVDLKSHDIVEINDFAAACVGLPREEIVGRRCHGFVCPNLEGQCPVVDLGRSGELAIRQLLRADGSSLAILKSVTQMRRHGRPVLVETFINVDDLLKTQEALKKAEETYRTVFMNTGTATFRVEESGVVSLVNQEFEKLSGFSREETEGIKSFAEFFAPEDAAMIAGYRALRRQDPEHAPRNYDARLVRRNGDARIVRVTAAYLFDARATIASFEDITDAKEAERLLRHQALHDALTGLPNRFWLRDRIEQTLASCRENGETAILLMDLDRFKDVNDSLGHHVGDKLLVQVADRLRAALRDSDTIARLGGDEFVLLLQGNAATARHVAQKALSLFAMPFDVDGSSLHVEASIGVVVAPEHGESPDVLLRNADLAMYQAKKQGRNRYAFFSDELQNRAIRRLTLENGLRQAIAHGRIEVHYQPKISLPDCRIYGFEALARWRKKDGSLVPPAEFIPVAEAAGLIAPLSEIILATACRQAELWGEALGMRLVAAVNISPGQFLHADMADRIIAVAQAAGLPPAALEVEITEDTLLTNKAETIRSMNRLNHAGVKIVLDDFGKGYSSLTYIKKLPISGIKIDRAFISGLPQDMEDGAIVRAILSMASNLSLRVVAEGVETKEQLRFLAELGCREFQGYYFSKPLPAAEMAELLAEQDKIKDALRNAT